MGTQSNQTTEWRGSNVLLWSISNSTQSDVYKPVIEDAFGIYSAILTDIYYEYTRVPDADILFIPSNFTGSQSFDNVDHNSLSYHTVNCRMEDIFIEEPVMTIQSAIIGININVMYQLHSTERHGTSLLNLMLKQIGFAMGMMTNNYIILHYGLTMVVMWISTTQTILHPVIVNCSFILK